jgi:hypothetical protein
VGHARRRQGIVRREEWSEDQDADLRTLVDRGCTDVEIAAALGRTVASVAPRRRRLGLYKAETTLFVVVSAEQLDRIDAARQRASADTHRETRGACLLRLAGLVDSPPWSTP